MNDISVDSDALVDLKLVMEDDFPVLLETFIKDSDERIKVLRDLVVKKDASAIRSCAHSLKGSSSNLGAPKLAELCRQVEAAGLSDDLDSVDQIINQVDSEYQLVRAHLAAMI